jgi:hypothetical protein
MAAENQKNRDAGARKERKEVVIHSLRRCAVRGRQGVGWCYRMCTPEGELGLCGFPAPHAAHSSTGVILREKKRLEEEQKKSA